MTQVFLVSVGVTSVICYLSSFDMVFGLGLIATTVLCSYASMLAEVPYQRLILTQQKAQEKSCLLRFISSAPKDKLVAWRSVSGLVAKYQQEVASLGRELTFGEFEQLKTHVPHGLW